MIVQGLSSYKGSFLSGSDANFASYILKGGESFEEV